MMELLKSGQPNNLVNHIAAYNQGLFIKPALPYCSFDLLRLNF
jgi:hypothetical protein